MGWQLILVAAINVVAFRIELNAHIAVLRRSVSLTHHKTDCESGHRDFASRPYLNRLRFCDVDGELQAANSVNRLQWLGIIASKFSRKVS